MTLLTHVTPPEGVNAKQVSKVEPISNPFLYLKFDSELLFATQITLSLDTVRDLSHSFFYFMCVLKGQRSSNLAHLSSKVPSWIYVMLFLVVVILRTWKSFLVFLSPNAITKCQRSNENIKLASLLILVLATTFFFPLRFVAKGCGCLNRNPVPTREMSHMQEIFVFRHSKTRTHDSFTLENRDNRLASCGHRHRFASHSVM